MFASVSCKVAVNLVGIPDQHNNCRIILALLDDITFLMLPLSFVVGLDDPQRSLPTPDIL